MNSEEKIRKFSKINGKIIDFLDEDWVYSNVNGTIALFDVIQKYFHQLQYFFHHENLLQILDDDTDVVRSMTYCLLKAFQTNDLDIEYDIKDSNVEIHHDFSQMEEIQEKETRIWISTDNHRSIHRKKCEIVFRYKNIPNYLKIRVFKLIKEEYQGLYYQIIHIRSFEDEKQEDNIIGIYNRWSDPAMNPKDDENILKNNEYLTFEICLYLYRWYSICIKKDKIYQIIESHNRFVEKILSIKYQHVLFENDFRDVMNYVGLLSTEIRWENTGYDEVKNSESYEFYYTLYFDKWNIKICIWKSFLRSRINIDIFERNSKLKIRTLKHVSIFNVCETISNTFNILENE